MAAVGMPAEVVLAPVPVVMVVLVAGVVVAAETAVAVVTGMETGAGMAPVVAIRQPVTGRILTNVPHV